MTSEDIEVLRLAVGELKALHAYCVSNAKALRWTRQQAECDHQCPTYEAIRGLEKIISMENAQ